ncbi:MAG: ATP synthase F1 subunit epsilon [Candidatus Peribacteraceae bacterium]|nr:ATP synthase F1 subunit epsilon [Candidatus Peribacteraceae bacterium]
MIHLSIITPEEVAFSADAQSITIPTTAGEITVLSGHIPLISTLQPGTIIVRDGKGGEQFFAVAQGVVEVEHNTIRILSDIADRVESLEEEAIEQAKKRAEEVLKNQRQGDSEGFAQATAILDRELARLKSVRRRRSSSRRSL